MKTENYVEKDCVFHHEDRAFEAGGAIVAETWIVGYCSNKMDFASTWKGNPIGLISRINSRPAIFFGRPSWIGSRYYYFRVKLFDGRQYACRGFGHGMSFTGRRIKS